MAKSNPPFGQQPKSSLARQVFPAIALTAIGVGFVSMLDGPSSGSIALSAGTVVTDPVVDSTPPTTIVANPSPSVPATQSPDTTLAPAPTPVIPETTIDNQCDGDIIASPSANFRFGIIQLQTTFTKSNVLCNVTVLQYPNDRRTSIAINNYALPIYDREAVQSHSANIRAVSGATYSWQAYVAALQAVLDSRG
jgi:uncharacterized protein with FMN-binding domain